MGQYRPCCSALPVAVERDDALRLSLWALLRVAARLFVRCGPHMGHVIRGSTMRYRNAEHEQGERSSARLHEVG